MAKLIVGAVAAVLIGAAAATGACYAIVSAASPDKNVELERVAVVNGVNAVDYGTAP